MVQPGTILGGRYRVGRMLGKGGMGTVVEATHLQLGTRVAIKILRAERMDDETTERFLREARAAAQLRGEHICRVHDFGTAEDGAPYMVMELLHGNDLAVVIEEEAMEPALACSYILQACAAIGEAHALGIIHRDLKPRNLFVVDRPDGSTTLKVLDFGIAKSMQKASFELTDTTNVIGSPAYMSPEQLKSSKSVDARSDIWSLGVVFYQLLSANQPFEGDSLTSLALAISMEPPEPLPDWVPPELVAVVMRCLEKDAAKRFPDVAALAAAVEPFAKAKSTVAGSIAQILTTGVAIPIDGESTASGLPSNLRDNRKDPATTLHGASGVINSLQPRSRMRLVVTAGVAALLAAVATTVVVLAWSPRPSATTSARDGEAPAPRDAGAAIAPVVIDAEVALPAVVDDAAIEEDPVDDAGVIDPVASDPIDAGASHSRGKRKRPHAKPDGGFNPGSRY